MKDCCLENLGNAKNVGRASWICPVCGSDVSLAYFYLQLAFHPEWEEESKKRRTKLKAPNE